MKNNTVASDPMVHLSPYGRPQPLEDIRDTRYSRVAILLHWLVAALVLSTIPIGWYGASSPSPAARSTDNSQTSATSLPAPPPPKSAARQSATNIHKTIGISILFFTVLRVGWRLTHKPPEMPQSMSGLLRRLARASHALFYCLLLVMPLSGWWMSSAIPDPKRHAFGFGIFDIPFLPVPRSWPSAGIAHFVHINLAWLMVGLAVLHIIAALKHHFVDKDYVFKRMIPRKTRISKYFSVSRDQHVKQ